MYSKDGVCEDETCKGNSNFLEDPVITSPVFSLLPTKNGIIKLDLSPQGLRFFS